MQDSEGQPSSSPVHLEDSSREGQFASELGVQQADSDLPASSPVHPEFTPDLLLKFEQANAERAQEKITPFIYRDQARRLSELRTQWLEYFDEKEVKINKREFGLSLFVRYVIEDWLIKNDLKKVKNASSPLKE